MRMSMAESISMDGTAVALLRRADMVNLEFGFSNISRAGEAGVGRLVVTNSMTPARAALRAGSVRGRFKGGDRDQGGSDGGTSGVGGCTGCPDDFLARAVRAKVFAVPHGPPMVTQSGLQFAQRQAQRRPPVSAGGPVTSELKQSGERAAEQCAGHGNDAGPHRKVLLRERR